MPFLQHCGHVWPSPSLRQCPPVKHHGVPAHRFMCKALQRTLTPAGT
jgi:hypothetical protein